jgi:endonuclease/exonuclease/phosphatase family metal-dependent hydrolase
LLHTDLILAEDLNFTFNSKEIWGTAALLDPLATFFKDLFATTPLVDVAPTELVPTWHNGRMGESSISKRLDRFFVVEDLIGPATRYRSWVKYTFISDHAPIYLQLDIGIPKIVHPFKFNSVWLKDVSFTNLTREV